MIEGIKRRIEDAIFLWDNGRKESAFLLALVSVAAISKLRYSKMKDGEAFKKTISDFHTVRIGVEYRGEIHAIEHIFYKWVRCYLIHESELPTDIEFQDEEFVRGMSVRAGGKPNYVLQLGAGWFHHFVNSVLTSQEMNNSHQ